MDTLFDTRLGALSSLPGVSITEILKNNRWHDRRYSDLRDLDLKEQIVSDYQEVYATRDKIILRLSPPTNMHAYIYSYVKSLMEDELSKAIGMATLTVNTYPYRLSKEEEENMKKLLISSTKIKEVSLIYRKPKDIYNLKEITPYRVIVLYDYKTMLDTLSEDQEIYKTPIIDKVLMIPDVFDNPPEDGMSEEEAEELLEQILSSVISASVIPVGWFSSVFSVTAPNQTDSETMNARK